MLVRTDSSTKNKTTVGRAVVVVKDRGKFGSGCGWLARLKGRGRWERDERKSSEAWTEEADRLGLFGVTLTEI